MAYRMNGPVERPRTVHLEALSRRIERLVANLSVPEVWASRDSRARLSAVLCPLASFQRSSRLHGLRDYVGALS